MSRTNWIGTALIVISLLTMGYFVHWILIPCLLGLFWGKNLEER